MQAVRDADRLLSTPSEYRELMARRRAATLVALLRELESARDEPWYRWVIERRDRLEELDAPRRRAIANEMREEYARIVVDKSEGK